MTTVFIAIGMAALMASGYLLLLAFTAASVLLVPFLAIFTLFEILRSERERLELQSVDARANKKLRLVHEVYEIDNELEVEVASDADEASYSKSVPDLKKVIW